MMTRKEFEKILIAPDCVTFWLSKTKAEVAELMGEDVANVMNWIKKRTRRKSRRICQKQRGRGKIRNGRTGRTVLVCEIQTPYRNAGECLYSNDGQSYSAADGQSCCK